MEREYTYTPIDDPLAETGHGLSALDLRDEARAIAAAGEPIEAAKITLYDDRGYAITHDVPQILYAPERGCAGIAAGGDAHWLDCDSLEDGIRRWLDDDQAGQ